MSPVKVKTLDSGRVTNESVVVHPLEDVSVWVALVDTVLDNVVVETTGNVHPSSAVAKLVIELEPRVWVETPAITGPATNVNAPVVDDDPDVDWVVVPPEFSVVALREDTVDEVPAVPFSLDVVHDVPWDF